MVPDTWLGRVDVCQHTPDLTESRQGKSYVQKECREVLADKHTVEQ